MIKTHEIPKIVRGHWSTTGLISYWPMMPYEVGGNIIHDLSENGLTLTASGATWTSGSLGSAVNFDSANDNLSRTGRTQLPGNATAMTFICRLIRLGVQPSSGFGTLYYEPKLAGTQDPIFAFLKDAGFRMRLNTDIDDSSGNIWEITNNFVVGEPHTIAWTWQSGETVKGYFDGVQQTLSTDGGTLTGTLKVSDNTIYIGTTAGLTFDLYAKIELLSIYNRALPAWQVAEITRNPLLPIEREPIELWVGATSVGVAPEVANPKGPLGHPLCGALAGPISF